MLGLSSKTLVNDEEHKLSEWLNIIGANRAVRADARAIKSVKIAHVLNNGTMNFDVKKTLPADEIYVFRVELREKRLPEKFASALAECTTPRTVFEFVYGEEYRLFTIPKNGKKLGKATYRTGWSKSEPQVEIPANTKNTDGVYVAVLSAIFQIKAREGETSADFIARFNEILRLRREEVRLQGRVDRERQPRPRFALNAELKNLRKELKNLQK